MIDHELIEAAAEVARTRCRQVLLDYFPGIEVIVGAEPRAVPIADLLPETYVWADHQEPTA